MNEKMFVGVDPGLNGGIAIINQKGIATARVMPTVAIKRGGKNRHTYDHAELARLFKEIGEADCYVCVEEQQAFPGQGVVSMYSIGYGYGMLIQCLHDFNIRFETVKAKEWQKMFGILGKKGDTKTQAARVCKKLYPKVNLYSSIRATKPHSGKADAILICTYGKKEYERRKEGLI
jgi:crossover junction endodeoxyribonuclease RuvC